VLVKCFPYFVWLQKTVKKRRRKLECACGAIFKSVDEKEQHIARHHSNGYVCSQCSEVLKSEVTYYKHILYSHTQKFRFNCRHCSGERKKRFGSNEKSMWAAHIAKHHPTVPDKEYKDGLIRCRKCGKICSTLRYLRSTHKCKKGG
jgi:hypothetical protein